MAEINDLNITDASNTARWPEGMAPSAVNNAARADEGILARWHKDTNGSLLDTGTANAHVVAANQTISAYYDGLVIAYEVLARNTGSVTLNVDAVGVKTIKKNGITDNLQDNDLLAGQKIIVVFDSASDVWQLLTPVASPTTIPTLLQGHVAGLTLSNGTDTVNDIDIAAGAVVDTSGSVIMELTAGITKRLDATWAVGDGNGGLDTGVMAGSSRYNLHLIRRSDTGVVDVLFSLANTNITFPTNYDQKQLIGSIITTSAPAIIQFKQVGDYFRLTSEVEDTITDLTPTGGGTWDTASLRVPLLSLAHVYGHVVQSVGTETFANVMIRTKGSGDGAAGDEAFLQIDTANAMTQIGKEGFVLVDANAQVEYTTTLAGGDDPIRISTLGWLMLNRGRNTS